MAKFKVNHKFKDKETKKTHDVGELINITVKRADEINQKNKNKVEMVTRVYDEETGD